MLQSCSKYVKPPNEQWVVTVIDLLSTRGRETEGFTNGGAETVSVAWNSAVGRTGVAGGYAVRTGENRVEESIGFNGSAERALIKSI